MKRTHWMRLFAAGLLAALFVPGHAGAQDTVYVPIEPCRLSDTRQANGKMAGGGEERNMFAFALGGEIEGQGGKEGGCGIPFSALAVHMVFTAVSPNGNGWLRAWAFGGDEPNATILNFVGGQNISGGVPVPVCPNLCAYEFVIKNYGSGTHVVIDAVGYYAPLMVEAAATSTQHR